MPDEKHLQIIRQGVDVWNQWREKNPEIREPDPREADDISRELERGIRLWDKFQLWIASMLSL
jgi:hypothetical protein